MKGFVASLVVLVAIANVGNADWVEYLCSNGQIVKSADGCPQTTLPPPLPPPPPPPPSGGGLCVYQWCNDFCSGQGFPTVGCDANDKCQCGEQQVSGSCTFEWCNNFCSSGGYPTVGCDSTDECKCGFKQVG